MSTRITIFLLLAIMTFSQEKRDSLYIESLISKADSLADDSQHYKAVNLYKNALDKLSLTTRPNLIQYIQIQFKIALLNSYPHIQNQPDKTMRTITLLEENRLDQNIKKEIYYLKAFYYRYTEFNMEKAIKFFRLALSYITSSTLKAKIYSELANTYFNQNYLARAINLAKMSLQLTKKRKIYLNDFNYQILTRCYGQLLNHHKSYNYVLHNYSQMKRSPSKFTNSDLAYNYIDQAYSENLLQNFTKAIKLLDKAKQIFKNIGDLQSNYGIAWTNAYKATSYRKMNLLDSSIHLETKAIKLVEEKLPDEIYPFFKSFYNITNDLINKGAYKLAYKFINDTKKRYPNHNSKYYSEIYYSYLLLSKKYPEINILENFQNALSLLIVDYDRKSVLPKISSNLLNEYVYNLFAIMQDVLISKSKNKSLQKLQKKFSFFYLNYLRYYKKNFPNVYFHIHYNKTYEKALFNFVNYNFKEIERLTDKKTVDKAINSINLLYNFKINHKLITNETLKNNELQDKVHALRESRDMINYYKSSTNAENKIEMLLHYSNREDSLLRAIRNESPLLENFDREIKFNGSSDIAEHLKENEAVISSMYLDSNLYHFIVRKDKSLALRVKTKNPDKKIESLVFSINTLDQNNFKAASTSVYQDFFQDLQPELKGISKLYLLPYGKLNKIPYESLVYQKKNESIRYLIEDFEISYHLSLPLLKKNLIKRGRLFKNKQVMAMAPVFRKNLKLKHKKIDKKTFQLLHQRTLRADTSFLELRESENEVKEITSLLRNSDFKIDAFFHEQANEAVLRSKLGKYDIVHLATHSVSNAKHPSQSRLFLSYKNRDDFKNDGVLSFDEINNMDIKSDLLVLSSCESGLGKFIQAEGNLNLSSAFYSSGAKNVVYSLWKVFDKATKDFMVRFYYYLSRGESISTSLRKTKLDFIRKPGHSFPKIWAGFVQLGVN